MDNMDLIILRGDDKISRNEDSSKKVKMKRSGYNFMRGYVNDK